MYNISFISMSDPISDQAKKIPVLDFEMAQHDQLPQGIERDVLNTFCVTRVKKLETLQRIYGFI